MKEIEILVEVYGNEETVLAKLQKFDYKGDKETTDIYYYDPLRDALKPQENGRLRECFRLRDKNGTASIAYKVDHFEKDDTWIFSDEYETKIDSFEQMQNIVKKLGLKELVTIKNCKKTFVHGDFEIVLEKVENLGLFMEVEYCTDQDIDVQEMKKRIRGFIDGLGIKVSEELNLGKPEMMVRKKQLF